MFASKVKPFVSRCTPLAACPLCAVFHTCMDCALCSQVLFECIGCSTASLIFLSTDCDRLPFDPIQLVYDGTITPVAGETSPPAQMSAETMLDGTAGWAAFLDTSEMTPGLNYKALDPNHGVVVPSKVEASKHRRRVGCNLLAVTFGSRGRFYDWATDVPPLRALASFGALHYIPSFAR